MDLNLPGSGQTVAQTFSVFDYDTGKYRYYTAPMSAPPLTGHYRAPRGRIPEALAASVPAHAKIVGEGDVPKGIVASLGSFGEAETQGSNKLLLAGVAAVLVFAVWRGLR